MELALKQGDDRVGVKFGDEASRMGSDGQEMLPSIFVELTAIGEYQGYDGRVCNFCVVLILKVFAVI